MSLEDLIKRDRKNKRGGGPNRGGRGGHRGGLQRGGNMNQGRDFNRRQSGGFRGNRGSLGAPNRRLDRQAPRNNQVSLA